MTLLEEVAMLLTELGLGQYTPDGTGGTVYLLALPSTPDVCMSVTPYNSGADGDAGLPYDKPRYQIRCRGTKADRTSGYTLGKAVYDALHGLGSRTLPGGTWMLQCLAVAGGGPGYIGVDDQGRAEFVINVELEVETRAPRARAV